MVSDPFLAVGESLGQSQGSPKNCGPKPGDGELQLGLSFIPNDSMHERLASLRAPPSLRVTGRSSPTQAAAR
jgi:hypothetical protein